MFYHLSKELKTESKDVLLSLTISTVYMGKHAFYPEDIWPNVVVKNLCPTSRIAVQNSL